MSLFSKAHPTNIVNSRAFFCDSVSVRVCLSLMASDELVRADLEGQIICSDYLGALSQSESSNTRVKSVKTAYKTLASLRGAGILPALIRH
jgi:hypothetical protein